MAINDDVKKLLGSDVDDKLEVIERRTKQRLSSLLEVDGIPESLDYIIYEVTLKRYNRIGNEGMNSYSQEGLSMAFPESDFDEYASIIDDFKKKGEDEFYKPRKGRFKFV